MEVKDLELKHFEDKIGQTITVTLSEELDVKAELKLTEATASKSPFPDDFDGEKPAGIREAPFSLIFVGPKEPILPPEILTMDVPEIGTIQISVSPIAQDDNGTTYQAVFS